MKKAYVKITSDRNITVTPGLQYKDVTNPAAQVADRLRVLPMWNKDTVDIKTGSYFYKTEILEWNTVKNLIKRDILTVSGIYADHEDGSNDPVERASSKKSAE